MKTIRFSLHKRQRSAELFKGKRKLRNLNLSELPQVLARSINLLLFPETADSLPDKK